MTHLPVLPEKADLAVGWTPKGTGAVSGSAVDKDVNLI